jgi:hypothetical protein
MMQPNRHDKDGKCLEIGNNAETELKKIAAVKGVEIEKSSRHNDMKEHFDYFFHHKTGTKKIEVKAMKKLSRSGEQQDEWIWVEFKNVGGNAGWLYGKADLIAFEFKEHFLFVNREELAALAEKLVDRETIVKKSCDAKYKGYRRWNRPNELTGMIHNKDLLTLSYKKVWKKIL